MDQGNTKVDQENTKFEIYEIQENTRLEPCKILNLSYYTKFEQRIRKILNLACFCSRLVLKVPNVSTSRIEWSNTLQHIATHTATHCNTLQQSSILSPARSKNVHIDLTKMKL